MTRKINSPTIIVSKQTQAVNAGGTGVMNINNAAAALQLVTNSQRNAVNGVVSLDANGKLPPACFPTGNGVNKVSLKGPVTAISGQILTYTITDYDAFKTYTISASAGTLTRVGRILTFIAPPGAQTVTLTVNGVNLSVVVSQPAPQTPTITSPTSGATGQASSINFTGNAFVAVGDTSAHAASDWQIASDAAFTTIVSQTIGDTTNKTTWTGTVSNPNTTYYARVRYKGTNGNYSGYSATVSFTTKALFTIGTEEAKLAPTDAAASDYFGSGVSISSDGTRIVVGAAQKKGGTSNPQGAAYVFIRSGNAWAQEQKLLPNDPTDSASFGASVSISTDGTRVVVGATGVTVSASSQGACYVFLRSGSTWTQEAKVLHTTPVSGDALGYSISMNADGTRFISGTPNKAGTYGLQGAAYVFLRTGVSWAQEAKLLHGDPEASADGFTGDSFGRSVSINGDATRVVVGAYGKPLGGSSGAGAAYVFLRTGTSWVQEAKLVSSDLVAGDYLGRSVSISADANYVTLGAPNKTISGQSGTNHGAAYIYLRTGTSWGQQQRVVANDPFNFAQFGTSVSLNSDGSRVATGAPNTTGTVTNQGSVYIVNRSGVTWTQDSKILASTVTSGDGYGTVTALSSDGTRVAAGSQATTGTTGGYQGAIFVDR